MGWSIISGKKRSAKKHDPLAKLPAIALTRLASILAFPDEEGTNQPSAAWLAQQKDLIDEIPTKLRIHRGTSLVTFFSMDKFTRHKLCSSHYELKPGLISWIFRQLAVEVTMRVEPFRAYRDRFADCPEEIHDFVNRTSAIASLYLSPDEFDDQFGYGVPQDYRFSRVKGGCAACILAVIGSRAQMLVDLRAGMVARASRRHSPRLLQIVDAWIAEFGENDAFELRKESERLAEEFGRVRVFMKECRRAKNGGTQNTSRPRLNRRARTRSRFARCFGIKLDDERRPSSRDGRPESRDEDLNRSVSDWMAGLGSGNGSRPVYVNRNHDDDQEELVANAAAMGRLDINDQCPDDDEPVRGRSRHRDDEDRFSRPPLPPHAVLKEEGRSSDGEKYMSQTSMTSNRLTSAQISNIKRGPAGQGRSSASHGGSQHGGSQGGGSQYGGSQYGGSQHGGSQHGGSQHGGFQHGGSQHGGSQRGGPRYGGSQHSGFQHGGSHHGVSQRGDSQHVSSQHGGSQHGGSQHGDGSQYDRPRSRHANLAPPPQPSPAGYPPSSSIYSQSGNGIPHRPYPVSENTGQPASFRSGVVESSRLGGDRNSQYGGFRHQGSRQAYPAPPPTQPLTEYPPSSSIYSQSGNGMPHRPYPKLENTERPFASDDDELWEDVIVSSSDEDNDEEQTEYVPVRKYWSKGKDKETAADDNYDDGLDIEGKKRKPHTGKVDLFDILSLRESTKARLGPADPGVVSFLERARRGLRAGMSTSNEVHSNGNGRGFQYTTEELNQVEKEYLASRKAEEARRQASGGGGGSGSISGVRGGRFGGVIRKT